MKRIINIIILALAAFIYGCNEQDYAPENQTDIPVVEGYLQPGNEISVNLSKMIPYISGGVDTTNMVIASTDVFIRYLDKDYLLEPVEDEPGKYICMDSGLILTPGDEYELHFDYNHSAVSAATMIPVKPSGTGLYPEILQINPNNTRPGMTQNKVTVYWDNPDNDYYLIITEYLDSLFAPINPYLDPEVFDDYRKISTKPVSDYSYDLDTRRQLLFFGHYRIIVYKVNEEYVNLYENISQSSLNLTEPLTNIENGLGIFTGVNSDTLLLEVQKIWW